MGIADPYVTLAQLKNRMSITETTRDTEISAALLAASRAVDDHCHRQGVGFWQEATATARTLPTLGRTLKRGSFYWLLTHDISTATGLIVETSDDGVTFTDVTADVLPVCQYELTSVRPYNVLAAPWAWSTEFVRVTARWGWPAVPSEVLEATRLLAARTYRRKDSPEGVLGSSDWGAVRVSGRDPDVVMLLREFIRPGF
jgi:hypothetical protein